MKKVLFAATLRSHIGQFHQPYLKFFKNAGYEVHIAAKDNSNQKKIKIGHYDQFHPICYERLPLKRENIKAYFQMKNLLKQHQYDIIHCHTPVAAVITRLVSRPYRKKGLKVIYTAHGFHFFKGAPRKNWLIYYRVEKFLSRFTDCLITINQEDYRWVLSNGFSAKSINFIKGVGVDLKEFVSQTEEKKKALRKQYHYNNDEFILLYAANLSYRKHQDLIIKAAARARNQVSNLKIILAGTGEREEEYRSMIKDFELENTVEMIGYVREIPKYMGLVDGVVSTARQEGLPINIVEAMATGLPIIATDCRGNRDLVKDNVNGFIVGIDDIEGMTRAIIKLSKSEGLCRCFGEKSINLVEKYSLRSVQKEMAKIYYRYI